MELLLWIAKTKSRNVRKLFSSKICSIKTFFLTKKIVMQHSGLNGGLQPYLLHLLIYQTLKLISPPKTESCSCLYFLYILLNNHISTPECPLLHIRAYHCQSFRISLQHVVHNMSCYTKPLFRSQKSLIASSFYVSQ